MIKAFEDGFPENWRELLLADLKSLNDEISLSFKESHKRYNLREENSSREKRSNSEEESTPQKESNRICEEQSEVSPLLEENVSHVETPEKKITPRQENKSSSKRRFKTPDQKQGSIVTSSGRLIRAPGNWWEIKPDKPEPNVKEEPKRRRLSKRILSSNEKNTPPSSSLSTTEKHAPTSKTGKCVLFYYSLNYISVINKNLYYQKRKKGTGKNFIEELESDVLHGRAIQPEIRRKLFMKRSQIK